MPLEAVMLVLDNSSYAINGDYVPSRFAAQRDAATILFTVKANSNPENVVGLMTMGGTGPEVLVTPTQDEGKIVAALHDVKLSGDSDLTTGIQVAQLALKHRQNKNQRQRVIVFVGSPLSPSNPSLSEASLVKLGKKMKKNNVAIDIISFGSDSDLSDNDGRLRAFVDAVNSADNSHFVTVPAGVGLLSDAIRNSGMLAEDGPGLGGGGDGGAAGGVGDQGDGEFGVDPNLDPELAMALRMSLEEERARQNASSSAAAAPSEPLPSIAETEGGNTATNAASSVVPAAATTSGGSASTPVEADAHAASSASTTRPTPAEVPAAAVTATSTDGDAEMAAAMQDVEDDSDDELQRALALSRGDDVEMDEGEGEEDELDEDEAIARAIAMSMGDDNGGDDAMEEDAKKS